MGLDMNVALKITAGVNGQQAVDQLRTSMDKLNGAAENVGKGFALAKTAVGAFIGLQAVQGVMSFARETINAADQLNDMSERTGMAISVLSELDYAARMNGRSLEDVQTALQRVAVKATDAATGNKAATIAFDALGVSVRNADGSMRTSLEITEDIGEAFQQIQDPTLKAALAVEFFGKQGPALIPLLENMQSAREEARELGVVMGDEFAKHAAEFNDNMDRAAFMARGFASAILSEVIPALSELFKEYRVGMKVFGSFGSALWNIGTTNPFKTPAEQAQAYTQRVTELEANIKRLDAAGTAYDRRNANTLRDELENTKKLAAYFREMAGIKEAGGGRGFVNPEPVKGPRLDAAKILRDLEAANKTQVVTTQQVNKEEAERTRILQSLNDEIQKMVLGEDLLTLAKLRKLGATETEIAQAEELMRQREAVNMANKEDEESRKRQKQMDDEALRSKEKLAEAGKRVFDETRSPAEKLNIEMARLNDLLQQGAIDWDTYSRAVFKAQDDFDDVGKKGKDTMADLQAAVEGWGRQATDTFVDFAFTGKASFKDLVDSILQDIARMLIQKMVMAPFMGAIGGMFGGGGGGASYALASGPAPSNLGFQMRAAGGPVSANTPYIVGEQGPELFVPGTSGGIVPNHALGGGETSVVVNVNVESGGEQVQSTGGAGQLGRLIAGVVKQELINQKRPGGLLAA